MRDQSRMARLIEQLGQLSDLQLGEVERLVASLICDVSQRNSIGASSKQWPHAPLHKLCEAGTYIVTGATLRKQHYYGSSRHLDVLETQLLSLAHQYQWQLEAWSIFSNHYHFVAHALADAQSLDPFLRHLHAETARQINRLDGVRGRRVWFNFRDTQLTYQSSYLARLNYVHQNAVKHRLVSVANQYRWCSAAWFERTATLAQIKTIYSMKTDAVQIVDDFDVRPVT